VNWVLGGPGMESQNTYVPTERMPTDQKKGVLNAKDQEGRCHDGEEGTLREKEDMTLALNSAIGSKRWGEEE
jgi:hypothetical protein